MAVGVGMEKFNSHENKKPNFRMCWITLLFVSLTPLSCMAEYNLDEMATTTCAGLSGAHGRTGTVVAVRRQCSNLASNCEAVCNQAPAFANAVGGFICFDSLHIYKNQPMLEKIPDGTSFGIGDNAAPPDEGKV